MSLENERPESFLGAMMAAEGVSDGYCIIHGPTGCKYYPASVSENRYPVRRDRPETRNMFRFADRYFFSQPRLPCTYLDMGKFITGGKERLTDLYHKVESLSPSLITIINSPGASLIGDDITSIHGDIPTIHIDHAEYSGTCAEGYQTSILKILETVKPIKTEKKKGVNLVGISVLHKNWSDTVNELSDLLGLCGVTVNCTVGAGWSVKDIETSASAELNVLVYPEYGDRVAEFYHNEYGIDFVGDTVPIGFDNIEKWVSDVCKALGKDPSPAFEYIREARRRAARAISLVESYHMLPKGRTFSLFCDGSTASAVSEFLYSYLGMIPVAMTCPSGAKWKDEAMEKIRSRNIPCSDDALNTEADIIITNGSIGSSCMTRKTVKGFVEIETPVTKYVCVCPEPPIGVTGTLTLIDRVLNIIASRQRFI